MKNVLQIVGFNILNTFSHSTFTLVKQYVKSIGQHKGNQHQNPYANQEKKSARKGSKEISLDKYYAWYRNVMC